MKRMIQYGLLLLACVLIALIGGFFYGRYTRDQADTSSPITTQIVIERITEQYFVVTRTVFVEPSTTIQVRENSTWSDILWKKSLEAEAMVRVDLGVDMSDLTADDIDIDHKNKVIKIKVSQAEILDASIYGDIDVESKSGVITVLKELFKKGSEDYSLASKSLIESATQQVQSDQQLIDDATSDSLKLLELLFQDSGYAVMLEVKE